MQHGSMIRTERQQGPDVWEFRWREPGPDGKRKHRRMVVGPVDEFTDELAARQAIVGLRLDINPRDARVKTGPITMSELTDHYRQLELKPDITWKTHSTKVTYEGYLRSLCLFVPAGIGSTPAKTLVIPEKRRRNSGEICAYGKQDDFL